MDTPANEPADSPTGGDGIHHDALVLSEVIKAAGELAERLDRDLTSAGAGDAAKRALAKASKLIAQASTALEMVESSLGIDREEPPEDGAASPAAALIRRALEHRRAQAPSSPSK